MQYLQTSRTCVVSNSPQLSSKACRKQSRINNFPAWVSCDASILPPPSKSLQIPLCSLKLSKTSQAPDLPLLLNPPKATTIIKFQHSPSRPHPEDKPHNMDTLSAAEAAYMRQVQLETMMMAEFHEKSDIAHSHGHHLGETCDKCDKEEENTDDSSSIGEKEGYKYEADGVNQNSHGIEGDHENVKPSPSSNDSHASESSGQQAKPVNDNDVDDDLVRRTGYVCTCCHHLHSLHNRLANRDDLVKFLDCPATYALDLEELKELMVTFNLAEDGSDGAAPGRIANHSELVKGTKLIQDGLEALNYAKILVNLQTVQQAERELGHGEGNMVGREERELQMADVIARGLQAFRTGLERLEKTPIATRVADHPTLLKGE